MDIIVEPADDDVFVLTQHLLQGRQIVRFTVVRNDNPLDVLKTDGLRFHGLISFLEYTELNIVQRSDD